MSFWDWLTKPIYVPGVTDPPADIATPEFDAWRLAVIARGNVVTRMPSGPSKGELSERYVDQYGSNRYALPPASVMAEDHAVQDNLNQQIANGVKATAAAEYLATLPGAPARVLAQVLGLPEWAVPVVVIAAVALTGAIVWREFAPPGSVVKLAKQVRARA